MAPIAFPFLRILNLMGNEIQSIEVIIHYRLPQLQQLILSDNNISSLKSLRKTSWKRLFSLDISTQCFI